MQVKDRAEKASVVISCEGCADETITFDIVNAKQDIYLPESYGRKIDEITVSNVTFPEKPDPNMVLSDTDMNNFVSWKMEVRSFQDFDKGWKFYRHTVKIPTIRGENKKALLSIGHIVYLEYEVWINGRLVDSDLSDYTGSQNPWPTRRKIYFDTCGDDSFEITIIIRANAGKAGIYGGEKEFSFSIL